MVKSILIKALLIAAVLSPLLLDGSEGMAQVIGSPASSLKSGEPALRMEFGLFGRHIEFSDTGAQVSSVRTLVSGGYGITDRLSLYGTVGAAAIRDNAGFDGALAPVYGGGFKLHFYSKKDLDFGLTGQFLNLTGRDQNTGGIDNFTSRYAWNEFNLALEGATASKGSSFYGAVLFSKVDGALKSSSPGAPSQKLHFRESSKIGFLVGEDVKILEPLLLGFELRLINEYSASIYLRYTFGSPAKNKEIAPTTPLAPMTQPGVSPAEPPTLSPQPLVPPAEPPALSPEPLTPPAVSPPPIESPAPPAEPSTPSGLNP